MNGLNLEQGKMRKNFDFSKGNKNPYPDRLPKEEEFPRKAGLHSLQDEIQKGIDQADKGKLIDGKEAMDKLGSQIKKRKT